jgi:uncharacterized protein YfiM (DUF2279 family)
MKFMITQKFAKAMLAASLIAAPGQSSAANTGPVETDKAAHFGLATVATATTIRIIQAFDPQQKITWANRIASSLLVGAASIAKERVDSLSAGRSTMDQADLAADGAGIIYANILMIDF